MSVYKYLLDRIEKNGAAHLMLIDPDKITGERLHSFLNYCTRADVDGILLGGSLLIDGDIEEHLRFIKERTELPVIIFPGSVNQVTRLADAILFLSLLSSRNAEHLIGKHVIAAPLIKKIALEAISTGYILIESGKMTTAEYMSGSLPVPRNKPEIAMAIALAGEYLGMKFIYLEAGSGAELPVPRETIKMVSAACSIPVIVGGGLRNTADVQSAINAGAKIIVTGNHFETESAWEEIKSFTDIIHFNK